MKSRTNILFGIGIGFLFIPLLLQVTLSKNSIPVLKGAFEQTDTLQLSLKNVISKKWQQNQEAIFQNNLSLKPAIVRAGHEIDYRLFREYHMGDLLLGKNDILFSKSWAKARCCETHLQADSLAVFTKKLGELSRLMKKNNKYFKVIIPPSKEEIYHSYLPNGYAQDNQQSDYKLLINELKANSIDYWDLLDYYQSAMDTSRFPIYSKTSVHWTTYGAHFALLKLLDDMNNFFHNPLPKLAVESISTSTFKGGDGDHEATLNLISRIDDQLFAYPKYSVDSSEGNNYRPTIITLGDSFYWGIKSCWMLPYVFDKNSKYLYYFSKVHYNNSSVKSHLINKKAIASEIANSDGLIILNSSHNLKGFPYGLEKQIDAIIDILKK